MEQKNKSSFSSNIIIKLDEYKKLCNFENVDYKNFFKSNFRFINDVVKRMLKTKESEDEIIKFLNDCIRFHSKTYKVLLMPDEEYGKYMASKAIVKL